MKLFIDTETTGLPRWDEDLSEEGQPLPVSVAMIMMDGEREAASFYSLVSYRGKIEVPAMATSIHGIDTASLKREGIDYTAVLGAFISLYTLCDELVGHNIKFDTFIMDCLCAYADAGQVDKKPTYCTMLQSTDICKLSAKHPGQFKWPKLTEAYEMLCGKKLEGAHNALNDLRATVQLYKKLKELGK